MATKESRSRARDKQHKPSGTNSPSKSRSRSRHKPRIKASKLTKNKELISLYEPSSKLKKELFELLRNEREEYMLKKEEAHSTLSTILNSMSVKQEERFECWNRSVIPKKIIKSIMNNVLNRNLSNNISKKKSNIDDKSVIVMQALSKCLVMELVNKSREIQKSTIDKFIQSQQKEKIEKEKIENNNNIKIEIEIEIPPFMGDIGNECNINNEENKNNLIGIEVLNEMKEKIDEKDNKNDNEEEKESEDEIKNEINEEFVLGAIRPIHIREALRKLQHDKNSFFHSKVYLFGSGQ